MIVKRINEYEVNTSQHLIKMKISWVETFSDLEEGKYTKFSFKINTFAQIQEICYFSFQARQAQFKKGTKQKIKSNYPKLFTNHI